MADPASSPPAAAPAPTPAAAIVAPVEQKSAAQRFITTYSTFLSSFVIGAAGLVATTVYQSKQQEIARRQADAQIRVSRLNTENQWRIERAEILAKNLPVLSTTGPQSTEQRYGVLLSLTRANIMDPELAISYALELGTHNPDHMRSVLANVIGGGAEPPSLADPEDSPAGEAKRAAALRAREGLWLQIDHGYVLSCTERYGVAREVLACKGDALAPRSEALADLVDQQIAGGDETPLKLLASERDVHGALLRRVNLFASYLENLYERRDVEHITRFEASSPGAHLVASVVLGRERPTERSLQLQEGAQKWLETYIVSHSCDSDCKGRIADVLLTELASSGVFNHALSLLLDRPDAERIQVKGRLQDRLLACRVAPDAVARIRDQVLVPLATVKLRAAAKDGPIDDLLDLLALVPVPDKPPERLAWDTLADAVKKQRPDLWRHHQTRRELAERQRRSPTLRKKGNFCGAPAPTTAAETTSDE